MDQRPPQLSVEEAIKKWTPRALEKAMTGSSELTIEMFLEGKGIPLETARTLTAEIMSKSRKKLLIKALPRLIVGWTLFASGLLLSIGSFFFPIGGQWIVWALPSIAGAIVLWGGHRRD